MFYLYLVINRLKSTLIKTFFERHSNTWEFGCQAIAVLGIPSKTLISPNISPGLAKVAMGVPFCTASKTPLPNLHSSFLP
ncbi:uncharacterized protein TOL2_C17780 [Desulfobacula toluolica Tol2]|uniref:Uncharacterized protein n=1 Tax=Desulfobacula toluolica (strain DSM 7467 / Tol2) TaxID=651182 RepID=K0N7K9_DESTT|nr:uncharacterized protein TOL2_C17780 [Desulfobacula toluolica Tol2]